MHILQSLIAPLPLLALSVQAHPAQEQQQQQHHARTETIHWAPCQKPNPTSMQCATLKVPLDYTDKKSTETVDLKLLRVPAAVKAPKKRSILLNFGGPGASGVDDFDYFAERIQAATGGIHDLITFVPRGTNDTLPFSCYADEVSRNIGTSALTGNASDVALGQVWAKATIFAETCHTAQNKTGNFIGTAFVARDMMRIVDALGEDGMLRYWGVSYGSLLGSTAVAMFPDKVDKVVLDGVVNPFEYYENREVELLTDTDASFLGFIKGCVAAPKACPLAQNLTAAELENKLYDFFETLKQNPIPIPIPGFPGGGLILDSSTVKYIIQSSLDFPSTWPGLSETIHNLMTGNFSAFVSGDGGVPLLDGAGGHTEALQGIKCSDVRVHTPNLDDMRPLFEKRHKMGRFFGDVTDEMPARCAQWKLPAKERYMGDFKVKPKNPVLLIGNTHDPVTPLVSARNVSETFEGSVLLHQDSYGHDSLMQGSLCTARAVRSYFVNGTLPKKGTKCEVKVPLFSGEEGWDEVVKQLKADPNATN
ncbi:Serine protease Hip1-like protein [Cladobotryum mycophilum]|uniref:Serine protease Hip1-like protein n=1 Tax=Cladobotryum mycophilum TaxID=491253 RepID=A0ABR0T0A2_9HYPO